MSLISSNRSGYTRPLRIASRIAFVRRQVKQLAAIADKRAAQAIQDWLGHRSIQHAVRYTELSRTRFRDF